MILLVLLVGVTLLALARGQRLAPWFLGVGVGLLGLFWIMNRYRIAWPNVPATVLFLNPYFLVTLAFVLVAAGSIGVCYRLMRWMGWVR